MFKFKVLFMTVWLSATTIPCTLIAKDKSQDKKPAQQTQKVAEADERVRLTSPLLAFADGKKIGIHAEYIGFILQILRELSKMQDGEKDAAGIFKGLFIMQGQRYTIRELHKQESALDVELCELQQMEIQHPEENDTLQQKRTKIRNKREFLQTCLLDAKKYFCGKILPFNEHSRGIKELTLALITEDCQARNRNTSFLLTWGSCPEGEEETAFLKQVVTFQQFDAFLTDLSDFLKDLVYSCPKARADFKELVRMKMEKQAEETDK